MTKLVQWIWKKIYMYTYIWRERESQLKQQEFWNIHKIAKLDIKLVSVL